MRADVRAGVLLLLAAAAVNAAAASPNFPGEPLRAALSRCLERHADRESIELSRQCPRLGRLLDAEASAGRLPALGKAPGPAALESLNHLLSMARSGAGALPGLDYASLGGILSQAYRPAPESPPGLWERFLRWLQDVLEDDSDAAYLEPIKRFLAWIERNVPVGQILGWLLPGLLIALVIGAAALLVQQLVSARGLPGLTADRRRGDAPGHQPRSKPGARDLAAIRRLPVQEQPGAVLQWAIGVLIRREALPPQRSRTNGELLRCLPAGHAGGRVFRQLIGLAEPHIYGGLPADDKRLDELYRCADTLAGDPGSDSGEPA